MISDTDHLCIDLLAKNWIDISPKNTQWPTALWKGAQQLVFLSSTETNFSSIFCSCSISRAKSAAKYCLLFCLSTLNSINATQNIYLSANLYPVEMFSYPCMHSCLLSCFIRVWLLVTPWTVASQAPLSLSFSRQEYWSGLPGPPPGDLLDPRFKPTSPVIPALQVESLPTESPGNPLISIPAFNMPLDTSRPSGSWFRIHSTVARLHTSKEPYYLLFISKGDKSLLD